MVDDLLPPPVDIKMSMRQFIHGMSLRGAIPMNCLAARAWADDTTELKEELEQMREQNPRMPPRLKWQQPIIGQANFTPGPEGE